MSKMRMVDTYVSRAKEYLFARRSRYYLREMRIKNSGQTRAKKNGTTAQVSTSLYSSSLCYLHSRGWVVKAGRHLKDLRVWEL